MRREKLVISLILVVMIVLLGTVSSYAVEITASSSGTNQTTITPANTAGNTIRPVNAASNTNNNVVNSTVNTFSNNTVINTPKASSSNTSNSSGLPYAGSGSIAGAFIVVVVLLGSSIFAYKKVSEYNV